MKVVEEKLADGLLRPIGFSTQGIDPAELRSFVDWSALPESESPLKIQSLEKESPLKIRVLEIALDDPETALRVARRAQRVIQACVGLSPKRRAAAINLVSAKQRDMAADPRVRVAACWLALELGSADLPAWVESCKWLSDPNNQSSDRFGEFVECAVSRSDPQQIAHLDPDTLIALLETSTNDSVRESLCRVLQGLGTRLDQVQAGRAVDALIGMRQKTGNGRLLASASTGLEVLVPRLESAQAKRVWDEVNANPTIYSWAPDVFAALVLRLEPARLKRALRMP